MRLKIAARQSDLARLQAQTVGKALEAAGVSEVTFNFRASLGDINLQDPLWKMPEKGVFTEDFLKDLEEGSCDLVVHSWKDLPTEPRKSTSIVATLPRADLRDLFLFRKDRAATVASGKTLKILTSSPRRAYNLEPFFKDHLPFSLEKIEFLNVRGNIPTRVRKLFADEENADGLILAKAAFDRLLTADAGEYGDVQVELRKQLELCSWMVLPLSLNPTAAAQGALAIEIRNDRDDLREVLSRIHCPVTFECVQKEREILSSYGGGCHQKIGVSLLRRPFGDVLFLRGLTDAGETLDRVELRTERKMKVAGSQDKIWPLDVKDGFFEREIIPEHEWKSKLAEAKRVWIARENALPENAQLNPNAILWCAGLKTWQRLASRGVWINGSAESLGEAENPNVDILAGKDENFKWMKVTHAASGAHSPYPIIATYRLKAKPSAPSLKGKTHFFWMSGSSFERALELNPEIKFGFHACGPGSTYSKVSALVPNPVEIFLNYDQWREFVAP